MIFDLKKQLKIDWIYMSQFIICKEKCIFFGGMSEIMSTKSKILFEILLVKKKRANQIVCINYAMLQSKID